LKDAPRRHRGSSGRPDNTRVSIGVSVGSSSPESAAQAPVMLHYYSVDLQLSEWHQQEY
jgi:hypothetical protein